MEAGTRTPETQRRKSIKFEWPNRLLGPAPGLKELNLGCWGALAAFLIIQLGVPLWVQFRTGVHSLHILPADFIYFYGIGRIANEFPLARLYDYSLQLQVFNQVFALHDGAYGPSPYPPFVALFFGPFARLPFNAAFAAWAGISLLLYVSGVCAALREFFPTEPLKVSLFVCFSLGFYPFLVGTLANGQLASVAVFAISAAFVLDRRGWPIASGLALSLLLYKPTLLLLLLPMMLLTRRFRALCGFISGGAILTLVATAFGGLEVWPAYARFLGLFGRVASLSDRSGLPLWKFVDLGSCIQAVSGGRSAIAMVVLLLAMMIVLLALAVLCFKSVSAGGTAQSLAWAAVLTWTLLINVYVPIYDSVFVVIAAALTLGALKELAWVEETGWMVLLSVLVVLTSWITSDVAMKHGIQPLSIALAVFGIAQLLLLRRSIQLGAAQEAKQPSTP
jgi:hypothetical protein